MKEKHIKIIVSCLIQALCCWFIYLEYHLLKADNRYEHMFIFTLTSLVTQSLGGGLIISLFEEDLKISK